VCDTYDQRHPADWLHSQTSHAALESNAIGSWLQQLPLQLQQLRMAQGSQGIEPWQILTADDLHEDLWAEVLLGPAVQTLSSEKVSFHHRFPHQLFQSSSLQ
jgi:hypothetical protein